MSLSNENESPSLWQRVKNVFSGKPDAALENGESDEIDPAKITVPCCTPNVHIAYRGKSDDRMYMAYNRTWQEVRYFQPNGLRVFCAECRRRVY